MYWEPKYMHTYEHTYLICTYHAHTVIAETLGCRNLSMCSWHFEFNWYSLNIFISQNKFVCQFLSEVTNHDCLWLTYPYTTLKLSLRANVMKYSRFAIMSHVIYKIHTNYIAITHPCAAFIHLEISRNSNCESS